jgi:uncharacterized MnhB-related membrane protein
VNLELIFSLGLALLILAVAGFVIVARGSFAAIVGFVAYGLLLSLAWMGLSAPDVALTEAALGGGVTGALLLGACSRLRNVNDVEKPPGLILMVYRALDTMLEKVVLLLALVAVWSLAPDRFWGGRPVFGSRREKARPLIFLARVLIPIGVLVGIYLFWVGADAPGGAFAGGAIISAMGILGFLAGVCDVPAVSGFHLRLVLVVGVAVFLGVGVAGLVAGNGFLTYPADFAKTVIVLIEVAMTLSIGAALALLVVGPPGKSSKP